MDISEKNLNFIEKLILKFFFLRKKAKKLHETGKSDISFLFIPHNEEKVFKITISYYLLSFLASIFILTLLSFFGFSITFFLKTKENSILRNLGNKQKIFFLQHEKVANELHEALDSLEKVSKELDQIIWGKSNKLDKLNFGNLNKLFYQKKTDLKTNLNLYQNTVINTNKLVLKIQSLKSSFQNSIDYLETRESIFESMPRGRPLGPGVGLITSTFGNREDPFFVGVGEFHNGIDFASASGTPIYATADGIIKDSSASEGGLGLHVIIEHENGFKTTYGHCSELFVKQGDIVKRGDIIAAVGSSGKATGSHLHYELRIGDDKAMNPQPFINID